MTTPSIKPTRVIRPPRRVTLPSGQKTYELDCDDGKTYTSNALARIVGLAKGASLVQRMPRMGWDSPTLLAPPAKRGFSLTGEVAKMLGVLSGPRCQARTGVQTYGKFLPLGRLR